MTNRQHRFLAECAGVLVVSAAWVGTIVSGITTPGVSQTLSNVGLAVAALSAGVACLLTARRSEGRYRTVWRLLGLSALSWGGGQVAWTWYESVLGVDVPFPSLPDVGYLCAVPLASAALLAVPLSAQTLAGRLRTVLDGLMIATAMLMVSWLTVLAPVVRAGGDGWVSQAISLAYPIGDVIAITIVLYVLLRSRQSSVRAPVPLELIGTALVAVAVSDSGFAYLTATENYASGGVIDIGWFLGYAVLLVAARVPPPPPAEPAPDDGPARPLGLLLPYAAVTVALASSVVELADQGFADPVVSWMRSALILMLIVRQVLTLLENLSLTRDLEARVLERTAELRASEQRFEALVLHSSDVVTIVDRAGTVLYQSESIQRVFGWSSESLTGRPLSIMLDPAETIALEAALQDAAREPYSLRVVELEVRHREGRSCHAEVTITNLLADPNVGGLVLNTRDTSERKALADQLVHQAFHDALTSLANRALFKDRVEHALLRGRSESVAVLFLDLDGFKEVNDSMGHAAGDLLLVQVAQRLRTCVRPGDTVARFGGDEFAILLDGTSGQVDAEEAASRVTRSLREPFVLDGKQIHVTGSVGIAVRGPDTQDTDQLLRNADLAMYRAKAQGGSGFEVFDPAMHTHLVQRLELEADLRTALDTGQLLLHYQPTVALASGRLTGVEALARWAHPDHGLIMPSQFIGLAEDTGLIEPLGRWVLRSACDQMARWHREHPEIPMSIGLNISGRQLQRGDLPQQVADALHESGLQPEHLVLEMTESVLMEHTAENLSLLRRLKELGVRLAIDDFGTGYSSLSYLHRFPVDILKIDRSFVERLGDPNQDAELVRTIVGLGRTLGMETIAEGIEDHHQFLALRRLGCDLGQGYYLGRPMPAADVDVLLTREQATADGARPRARADERVATAGA